MKMINPNVLDEGNYMMILDDTKYQQTHDNCDLIVMCNNCGQPTEYGKTRMCCGYVGCDNKITIDGKEVECYFGDLQPRVMKCHDSNDPTLRKLYVSGKLYRFRDGVE